MGVEISYTLKVKHINIEIKVRCKDPDRMRDILKSRGAEFKGVDHQIDTYFKVDAGRLKLREGNIENYLIFYERENQAGPKQSNISLFETKPNSSLKMVLTDALGVLVVVDKKREIYFISNVKFHIDVVEGLGSFIEIEAKGNVDEVEVLHEQCRSYMELFGIADEDLVDVSYSDLLMAK